MDFNPSPPLPFISVVHTSTSFHPFTSSLTDISSFSRTFSSTFCLSGTCWVFILVFVGFRGYHSFNVTFSFPCPSPFFILMKINTHLFFHNKNNFPWHGGGHYRPSVRWLHSIDFLAHSLETSVPANELSEESDQFRFLRTVCLTNLKGSADLILAKVSDMWISIPFDLSSRSSYHYLGLSVLVTLLLF